MARLAALLLGIVALGAGSAGSDASARCTPTRADALGPFYKPGAPVRSKVGTGYVLSGRVVTPGCRPVARARVEFWLVNARGQYDDAHRATLFARGDGRYRFESNRPIAYQSRPPHIHVRVSARGFRTLVTQHYPRGSKSLVAFNLVLVRR